MWEISLFSQFNSAIFCFIFGIVLSFEYFFVFELFYCNHSKISLYFIDLVFWVLSAFEFFFIFLAFSNGKIRIFLVLLAAAGFIFSYKYFYKIRKLFKHLFITLRLVVCLIFRYLQIFMEKTLNILKKTFLYLKKLLINTYTMLYNFIAECFKRKP